MNSSPRSGCPLNAAVEVLGDRWTIIVLRDIMFSGNRSFRTLQRGNDEGIASNILAGRLRDLVTAGLLTRDNAGPGQRATYSLTEAAIELVPAFAQLSWWGVRHRETSDLLRARAELLYGGGPELWDEFMDELREIHLGIPAPPTGRQSVREQLEVAGAPAAAAPAGPRAATP